MNCDPHVKLCPDCMRAWLDRKPQPGSWRDFEEPLVCLVHGTEVCAHDQASDERPWEEFELSVSIA